MDSISSKKSAFGFFDTLRRSNSRSSQHSHQHDAVEQEQSRTPASPKSLGIVLGEMTVNIPTDNGFSKVVGSYRILSNKKDMGHVNLQVGMFLDTYFLPEPVKLSYLGNAQRLCRIYKLFEFQHHDSRRSHLEKANGCGVTCRAVNF